MKWRELILRRGISVHVVRWLGCNNNSFSFPFFVGLSSVSSIHGVFCVDAAWLTVMWSDEVILTKECVPSGGCEDVTFNFSDDGGDGVPRLVSVLETSKQGHMILFCSGRYWKQWNSNDSSTQRHSFTRQRYFALSYGVAQSSNAKTIDLQYQEATTKKLRKHHKGKKILQWRDI